MKTDHWFVVNTKREHNVSTLSLLPLSDNLTIGPMFWFLNHIVSSFIAVTLLWQLYLSIYLSMFISVPLILSRQLFAASPNIYNAFDMQDA